MTFEVFKGVPIPIGQHGGVPSQLRRLQIGDSFLIPKSDLTKNTRASLFVSASRAGIKIMTRSTEEGLRVWRVEKSSNTITRVDEIIAKEPQKKMSVSELKNLMGGAILKTSPEFQEEPVDDWIYLDKPTYNEQTGKNDYFRKKPKGQWVCYKSETHWD